MSKPKRATVRPINARAQLARVLELIPRLADGEPRKLSDLAEEIGVDAPTVKRLLQIAIVRYDSHSGYGENVRLGFAADTVQLESTHFRRPMRLTREELRALELGLGVLKLERPPDEHRAIDGARERLRALQTPSVGTQRKRRGASEAEDPEALVYGGPPLKESQANHLQLVRRAIRLRRKVELRYRKASDAAPESRVVSPYLAVRHRGRYFVVAWCEKAQGQRNFRLDRIAGVTLLDERRREAEVNLEGVFKAEAAPPLRVKYSARIARWIEEREVVERLGDGSVVATYPLGDVDWAVRHVLQYGAEAEVVEPEEVRRRIADVLTITSPSPQ